MKFLRRALLLGASIGFLKCSAFSQSISSIDLIRPSLVRVNWQGDTNSFYQLEVSSAPTGPFLPYSSLLSGKGQEAYLDTIEAGSTRFYRLTLIDSNAAQYARQIELSNPTRISELNQWILGLQELGLYDHIRFMAPLQSDLNTGTDAQVLALRGPNGVPSGFGTHRPTWTPTGLSFAADSWVEFPNPFPTNALSEFSLLAVFASDQNAFRFILGSQGGGKEGPALLAGGSSSQGVAPKDLFFDYTPDGHTYPLDFNQGGRKTYVGANTGYPGMALATYSPTDITCQANMDLRFHHASALPPAWNGNPSWRIGARLDNFSPFVGTISLAAAFDVAISDASFDQIRRLYRRTIGSDVGLPSINVMIEGDSMSEESVTTTWGELLFLQPNWKGKFNKRNAAKGGETIGEMLVEFPTQVLPYSTQPGKNYLFFWGGTRELQDHSGEAAFADLLTYWAKARAAGFTIVAFTVIPYVGLVPEVSQPRRVVFNELIRQAPDKYDYLVDIATHPLLQDPYNTKYFKPDHVHMTLEGNELIAEAINALIRNP